MSVKTDLSCSKFQANMFDKSRCQNCFKSRELHLMTSEEYDQAKPIYASWLCLAPEGTDFDNPMQRSRKWQRRFFILYEHGSLQFALDESPSTIPQGTADLNLCTEVIDAEARTGQKNALCIITPEQELYIRGDSKEIINGWNEQLTVFLQTNQQNQRKKRSASSVQSQEQTCEKAVCSTGASETGAVEGSEPCSPKRSTKTWANGRDQDGTHALATEDLGPGNVEQLDVFHEICRVDTVESSRLPTLLHLSCSSPEPWATQCDPFSLDCSLPPSNSTLSSSTSSVDWELDEDTDSSASSHDGSFSLRRATEKDQTDQHHEECDGEYSCLTNSSRVQDDDLTDERKGKMCQRCRRQGRSRSQTHIIQKEKSEGFLEVPQSSLRPLRRARSLDGRASDSTMRPDLLNFKKGWLLSLNDHEQWRKYWFVLSAHSLHYYLDSGAEESSELVGEIDLTTCYQVTENQVQRNYGFQLHTHTHVYTLAAMTAGIRQNWIQALMKNLQNHNAPDVASLAENLFHQVEALCGPDVTQDSRFTQRCPEQQSSHNRRHEHGAKTFGWDEVGHSHMMDPGSSREQKWVDLQTEKEQESRSRRRGREERRQRYAIVMGSSACPKDESSSLGSPEHQQQQQRRREIEERWLQVERTAIREGKKVPLYLNCESKSTVELEKLLEHYQRRVKQLTVQLTESADENQSLEQEHSADWSCQEPTHDLGVQHKPQMSSNKQNPVLTLTDKCQETKQLLQLENLRRQQISNQLGLCPSAHFIKEPEIKNECNVDCERTFNKSSLASHAWCEASRDWEDEHSRAEVDGFSERAALVVKENTGSDPTVVNRFSQEAEFLARQNEALKQHNQELLNQLAEANREIDRLKAELRHQPNSCQPELESVVEPLEMESSWNREKLQEAQNKLAEMEEHLKDTQRALQLSEATLRGLGFLTKDREKISKISAQGETDRLCQSEIKLSEVDSQLSLSEQTCKDLQTQNVLLMESELLNGHRTIEAEETIKMLKRELEPDTSSQWEGLGCLQQQQVHDGRKSREGIQRVVEESVRMRSVVLSKLLEVIRQIAGNEKQGSTSELENIQLNPTVVKTLQLEKNIWESVVNALKDNPFQGVGTLLWYGNRKLEEVKMCLSALSVSTDGSALLSLSKATDPRISTNMSLSSPDIIGTHDGTMKDEKERTMLLNEQLDLIWTSLKQHVNNRLTLLNHVVSKLESPMNEGQFDVCMQANELPSSVQDLVVSAGLDIFTAYLVGTVDVQKDRTLPIFEPFGSNVTSVEVQTENHEKVLEQNNNCEETGANEETESLVSLKSRIKELEHLSSEGVKRLASLQQQHEEDKDRLQMDIVAAYEQGFTLLKESHHKLTEDLLIKHQQEQELLQEEKERLLAEEAAATLTVIEAMKRAHCSELERVLQKANQEKSSGDTSIAEILKNHSEELASVERELDVLSELYSQKCLESVHLAQALEAERKALQHCQHQNQALHTCNQELNNHLAEEVIRLSTKAKEGIIQLVDDRQQYELEIMLRVKETEVIYLQQKISTLKNELEGAQADQRLAIDRYQEIQMDHCMVKEKAEQQIEQLREHLRLAYEALAESMEKKTSATAFNMARYDLLKS
ncbi:hypothetical protein MHYP_G00156170 [Metynnis hypsauchen]